MPRTALTLATALLGLLVAMPTSAQGAPPDGLLLGNPTTQHLDFQAGANLVSLHVYPEDRSLEALFGEHLDEVLIVKDAAGVTFAPGHGIEDLTLWPADQAVHVFARAPFALDIEGRDIQRPSVVPLGAGWSWVPVFADVPLAVETAFASLGDALSTVQDGDGRAFPAVSGQTPLDMVEPGRGYRLRLASASHLSYAVPEGAGTQQVPTVLDAIALQGLAVGDEVEIQGFRAPGDGGAGLLRVTDSGCAPDGGTCFVPTEHTEPGEPYTSSSSFTLFGEDLQWESFRLCHSASDAPQDPTVTAGNGCYDALQLHGHGGQNGGGRLFDPATGHVSIASPMRNYAKLYDGDNSGAHTSQHRYATSDVRLERVIEEPLVLEGTATTDYVRPEWWGTSPLGSAQSGVRFDDLRFDATDAIAWAIESAYTKSKEHTRDVYVVLDGMYGYSGTIEIRDGVVLKGRIDGVRDGQGLRVLADVAWHSYTTSFLARSRSLAPEYAEPAHERDALLVNGERWVLVRQGPTSLDSRIVDLDLDGNLAENDYAFSNEYASASGPSDGPWPSRLHEWYRNTSNWTGVATTIGSSDAVPGRLRLLNVHVHDYGNSCVLGNNVVHFGGSRNIKLGNSLNNHLLYGTATESGTYIENVELYGFTYGTMVDLYTGSLRDVTVNVTQLHNPIGIDMSGFLNPRHNPWELAKMEAGEPYIPFHEYGETTIIDGLHVSFDLPVPDGHFFNLFTHTGGHVEIRDLTITGNAGNAELYYSQNWYGNRPSSFVLDGVTTESAGLLSSANALQASVRNVQSLQVAANTAPFIARPGIRSGEINTLTVYDTDLGDLEGPERSYVALKVWPFENAEGFQFFADRSRLPFQWGTPVQLNLNRVDWSGDEIRERIQLYFRDTQLTRVSPGHVQGGYSYFERVTLANGRTSESSGSVVEAYLSEEGTLDIPTTLFAVPTDPENVVVSGVSANRFLGWENVGDDDNPILRLSFLPGPQVTFDWSAAVRPIPVGVRFPQ